MRRHGISCFPDAHTVSPPSNIRSDFVLAEAITFPITALALLWVFGSLWAAMIPLATGLLATAGALAVLRFVVAFTPVSIFALNLATGLSLALAIDYSLLLVSRYREERRGDDGTAVRRTLQTAGRTVLTSAATVAFSLAGLAAFPMYALRSFAYAGVAVVVFAAAAAVIVTPALLLLLGERIDRLDIRRVVRRGAGRRPRLAPVERSGWYRISGVAMRHAVPAALMVAAVLVLLGAPFLRARWGPADDRMLPPSAAARQVGDALRRQMASGPADLVTRLVPLAPRAGRGSGLGPLAAQVSEIPGVTRTVAPGGVYRNGRRIGPSPEGAMRNRRWAYLTADGTAPPLSAAASQILTRARAVPWPAGTLITGPVAENADSVARIGARLPLVGGVVAVVTMAMVFLLTRSILLPVKALLLTVISLTASFGVLVWVFQEGHLLHLVFGSTSSGFLIPAVPVVMFCVAFGMSLDYEIFLLSRICEEWRASPRSAADNDRAVRLGLAKTGRVVTAAAWFMVIVFAGLATSRVVVVEMIGTGLGAFVLIDSTLIRGLLLPALMHLLGRANWWAPAFLRREPVRS